MLSSVRGVAQAVALLVTHSSKHSSKHLMIFSRSSGESGHTILTLLRVQHSITATAARAESPPRTKDARSTIPPRLAPRLAQCESILALEERPPGLSIVS